MEGGEEGARRDELKKDVVRMKRDYTRVKEEIHHARQQGNRLSKSIVRTEKKVGEMQRELERTDFVLKHLLHSDG